METPWAFIDPFVSKSHPLALSQWCRFELTRILKKSIIRTPVGSFESESPGRGTRTKWPWCLKAFRGGGASLVAQWLRICLLNAGDTGSSPGLGRSHMPRSSWAREPQLLSLRVWSLCSATREATTVRGPRTAMKSGPRLPQLEKALAQKRRPNTAKINK